MATKIINDMSNALTRERLKLLLEPIFRDIWSISVYLGGFKELIPTIELGCSNVFKTLYLRRMGYTDYWSTEFENGLTDEDFVRNYTIALRPITQEINNTIKNYKYEV